MNSKKLALTVKDTAEMLGLSRASVYQGVRTGEIPHVRIGKRILIPRRTLERILDGMEKTIKQANAAVSPLYINNRLDTLDTLEPLEYARWQGLKRALSASLKMQYKLK